MPTAGRNQPILTVTEAAWVQKQMPLEKLPDAQKNASEQGEGLPVCTDP